MKSRSLPLVLGLTCLSFHSTQPDAQAATLLLHLNASDLALADGAGVSSWGGLSQPTAARQPTYQASNPAFNGKPTVNFDGSNNPNGDVLTGLNVTGAKQVIAVTRLRSGTGSLDGLISNGSDGNNLRRNNSTNFYRAPSRGENSADFSSAPGGYLTVNGVASGAFVTDVAHTVVTTSTTGKSYGNLHVGAATTGGGGAGNRYWTGDVAEILIYDDPLDRDERHALESRVSQEYGLGYFPNLLALPGDLATLGESVTGTPSANAGAGQFVENALNLRPDPKYFAQGQSPELTYDFGNLSPTAWTYSITSGGDVPNRDPLNWNILGSNDGVNFTIIDSQSGIDFPNRNQGQLFSIANPGSFSFYRFDVLANNGDGNTQFGAFQLFGAIPEPSRAMLLLAGGLGILLRRRRTQQGRW